MTIEKNICDAIDIIVQQAISQASYDKTIKAVISECVDSSIGQYTVKYQDAIFYAYSQNTSITYTNGTSVWVLVPGNDMSQTKTILGTVTKLGEDYVTVIEDKDNYEINGINCIESSTTEYGLKSYLPSIDENNSNIIVLYSRDDDINLIELDTVAVEQYIKSSNYIFCAMNARTELPTEQQTQGNYGIIFALDFLDTSTGNTITRYYIIDVDNMTGNPYKFITAAYQYAIFSIDVENFIDVNYISLFCYNFPYSKDESECVEDIFLSDFEFYGVNFIEKDDNGYSLTIRTPLGRYFSTHAASSDTRSLVADFRINGNSVTSNLTYYWFIEHAGISTKSIYYNKYGGQGWKCLNDYNIVSSSEDGSTDVIEWLNGESTYIVTKEDLYSKTTTFKLVVIYAGTAISKTIDVINLSASYVLSIESDLGVQFYYNQGYPTLQCLVNGESDDNLTYVWSVTDINGSYSSLSETSSLNENYAELLEEYNQLLEDIESGQALLSANEETLTSLESQLSAYDTITRVDGNTVYHLAVSTITTSSTYKCTVYADDVHIGTVSIVLYNTLEVEGNYSLVLNNGSYTYKYDESGVSPASESLISPIAIPELSFTLYDNLGNELSEEVINNCDIQWLVPNEDSMIEIPSDYTPAASANGYDYYINLTTLVYTIADVYDASKVNNNIKLIVGYQDLVLTTTTNLTFIKEGESGTNGTEFTCKIIPNSSSFSGTPLVTEYSNGSYDWNFTPITENKYFKIQLYHNEALIFDGVQSGSSEEGKTVSITWDVIGNRYTVIRKDSSDFSITESGGEITFNGYTGSLQGLTTSQGYPVNIIKATVEYDDVTYYVTLPILTAFVADSDYTISLAENTGFLYSIYTTDGQSPQYANVKPFEIPVTRLINGYVEDVSELTNDYGVDYSWNYLGSIYSNSLGQFIEDLHLSQNLSYEGTLANNQMAVKPDDSFDGECLSNAVEVIVTNNAGSEVARIHIPVHMYLNRYGQAALNSWDGNSISITEDGGYILAPQVGAGYKEDDNSFTGVLMGKVKESGSDDEETGLFGYYQGVRTIFLNAQTGSAAFGATGKGQIVIDPTNDTAQIYSGNYSTTEGTGLLIDLTTPEIRYGSGNFVVDANGYVYMTGATVEGYSTVEDVETVRKSAVVDVTTYYAEGTSQTTAPTSGWSSTQPAVRSGYYIWSRTIVTYGDGNQTETYMCLSGNQGVGIASIVEYYLTTTSVNTPSIDDNEWFTSFSDLTFNSTYRYLWNYESIIYTDGSIQNTAPVVISVYAESGAEGRGIASIINYYAVSASITNSPTDGWTTDPSEAVISTTNKYLWNYEVIVYTDGTSDTTTAVVVGAYGDTGVSLYTWIKFASDEEGSDMSDNPDGMDYIGLSYNNISQTESNDPSDYTWSLFKGSDGVDGESGYTWIKFADDAIGTNMSDSPTDKYYIGFAYNKDTQEESDDPSDYDWALFRGSNGVDGTGVNIKGTAYVTNEDKKDLTADDYEIGTSNYLLYMDEAFTNQIVDPEGSDAYLANGYLFVWSGVENYFTCVGLIQGVGVSYITEYYGVSSDTSIQPTSWSSVPNSTYSTISATNKYLWNYEQITYTDGSITETSPVIIGNYAEDGIDGSTIESIVEYYGVSSEIGTQPSTWTIEPSASEATITAINKYLWNYEVITYIGGSEETKVITTDPVIIGVYGDNGIGVEDIVAYYIASNSSTNAPSFNESTISNWSTNVKDVTVSETQYLWMAYLFIYTDGSETYSQPACLTDSALKSYVETYVEKTNTLETTVEGISGTISEITTLLYYDDEDTGNLSYQTIITNLNDLVLTASEITTTLSSVTETIQSNGRNYCLLSGDYYLGGDTGWHWTDLSLTEDDSQGDNFLTITTYDGYTQLIGVNLTSGNYAAIDLSEPLELDTTYTLTMKLRMSSKRVISLLAMASTEENQVYEIALIPGTDYDANTWFTMEQTFTVDDEVYDEIGFELFDAYTYAGGTIDIAWIKVEKGSIATDWTYAPEDVSVAAIQSIVSQTSSSWTAQLQTATIAIEENVATTLKDYATVAELALVLNTSTGEATLSESATYINIKAGKYFTVESGNFEIDSDGDVTMTGTITATGGYLGDGTNGFTITSTAIYNKKSSLNYYADGIYIGTDGIALGSGGSAAFKVTSEGVLTAESVSIEGEINATSGYIGSSSSNGITLGLNGNGTGKYCIYYNKSYFESTSTGFYIGRDGIALGSFSSTYGSSTFQVNSSGTLSARNAVISGTITAGANSVIGGWTLTSTTIYKASTTSTAYRVVLNAPTSPSSSTRAIYIQTGTYDEEDGYTWDSSYPFYVRYDGYLYATSGTFTGTVNATSGSFTGTVNATSGSFTGTVNATSGNFTGTITAGSGSSFGGWYVTSGAIYRGSSSWGASGGMYFGSSGLSVGSTFTVDSSGHLTCTSATIGGYTVGADSIYSDGVTLTNDGIAISSDGVVENSGTITSSGHITSKTGDSDTNYLDILDSNIYFYRTGTAVSRLGALDLSSTSLSSTSYYGTGMTINSTDSFFGIFVADGSNTPLYIANIGLEESLSLSYLPSWCDDVTHVLFGDTHIKGGLCLNDGDTTLNMYIDSYHISVGSEGQPVLTYYTSKKLYFGTTAFTTYIQGSTIYSSSTIQVSSDKNLKCDIGDIDTVSGVFDSLHPIIYHYKDNPSKYHLGFIAQEVQSAFTDSGLNADDYAILSSTTNEDESETYMTLAYSEIIALLVAEVQNLKSQVKALQA